jgi:hypothetical protein
MAWNAPFQWCGVDRIGEGSAKDQRISTVARSNTFENLKVMEDIFQKIEVLAFSLLDI